MVLGAKLLLVILCQVCSASRPNEAAAFALDPVAFALDARRESTDASPAATPYGCVTTACVSRHPVAFAQCFEASYSGRNDDAFDQSRNAAKKRTVWEFFSLQ